MDSCREQRRDDRFVPAGHQLHRPDPADPSGRTGYKDSECHRCNRNHSLHSSVPSPFPTEQEGSADAAGENIASPVNETKMRCSPFSRITEEAVTAGATTPQVATSTGNGTSLVSRSNRDLAAAAAEPAATAAATADTGTTFVSRTRSLAILRGRDLYPIRRSKHRLQRAVPLTA